MQLGMLSLVGTGNIHGGAPMYFYQQPLIVYILHDAACRLTNEHIIMTIHVQPIQWIVCIYNAGEVCLNGSADLDQADLKGSRSTHSDSKGDHELEFQSMPCYESRSGCAAFTFFFRVTTLQTVKFTDSSMERGTPSVPMR